MSHQELQDLISGINFDNVYAAAYTTGSGWTNAVWKNKAGFIQFLRNCMDIKISIQFSETTGFSQYTNHCFKIENGTVLKTQ